VLPGSPLPPRWRSWVPAALIVFAAAVAYAPSLGGGFVFDDHILAESSPLLTGPLWRIWFTADAADYWPLSHSLFWIESRIFGQAALGYRLVNLALHAGVAVLLSLVLARLRVRGAWLAGILFAIHPVAVESVAWISELKNVLSGVFFLGAALAWLAYRESQRTRTAALACGLFACALLAKASTVMLPVVLLGLALAGGRRPSKAEWGWLGVLFALALTGGVATMAFQWLRSMEGLDLGRGIAERVTGAGWAWATYLWTALQPYAAAVVYPARAHPPGSASSWLPFVAAALLAATLWLVRARTGPAPLLAFAFHGLMVLPVLGLLDMAFLLFSPAGNHLQYLALMAPAALAGHGLGRLAEGRWRGAAVGASALLVVALLALTVRRSAAYVDDLSLWTAAVREAPQSLTAARLHAGALATARREREAIQALEAAVARLRDPADAGRARALLLAQLGRGDEALAAERAANAVRPDLGFQYELGVILRTYGRPELAVPLLAELTALQPRSAPNRYQLASALAKTGRLEEAVQELRVGCRLSPRYSDACPALAMVLVRLGRAGEARREVATAMGVATSDPMVDEVLGAVPSPPPAQRTP
jgi:tetratricopeptide (TPR) repeat protein